LKRAKVRIQLRKREGFCANLDGRVVCGHAGLLDMLVENATRECSALVERYKSEKDKIIFLYYHFLYQPYSPKALHDFVIQRLSKHYPDVEIVIKTFEEAYKNWKNSYADENWDGKWR